MNSVTIVNRPEEERIKQDVPINRLFSCQPVNEELFDGPTKEAKSIELPLVPSPIFEESTIVQEWNLEGLGPENEGFRQIAPWILALVKSDVKMMAKIPARNYPCCYEYV